jgi:hypothetical protein
VAEADKFLKLVCVNWGVKIFQDVFFDFVHTPFSPPSNLLCSAQSAFLSGFGCGIIKRELPRRKRRGFQGYSEWSASRHSSLPDIRFFAPWLAGYEFTYTDSLFGWAGFTATHCGEHIAIHSIVFHHRAF